MAEQADTRPAPPLTDPQKAAVAAADAVLKENGLKTYSQMEEMAFGAMVQTLEAVDIGKGLLRRLDAAQKEIKRLKN